MRALGADCLVGTGLRIDRVAQCGRRTSISFCSLRLCFLDVIDRITDASLSCHWHSQKRRGGVPARRCAQVCPPFPSLSSEDLTSRSFLVHDVVVLTFDIVVLVHSGLITATISRK